jgi:hypothetical protein
MIALAGKFRYIFRVSTYFAAVWFPVGGNAITRCVFTFLYLIRKHNDSPCPAKSGAIRLLPLKPQINSLSWMPRLATAQR